MPYLRSISVRAVSTRRRSLHALSLALAVSGASSIAQAAEGGGWFGDEPPVAAPAPTVAPVEPTPTPSIAPPISAHVDVQVGPRESSTPREPPAPRDAREAHEGAAPSPRATVTIPLPAGMVLPSTGCVLADGTRSGSISITCGLPPTRSGGATYGAERRDYDFTPPARTTHRFASDPGRVTAIVLTSLGVGVATEISAINYFDDRDHHRDTNGSAFWLATSLVIAPSLPRWVVGDARGALVWTGARAASMFVALVSSDDESAGGRIVAFGIILPTILAVVDLATTPHREDLVDASLKRDSRSWAQIPAPASKIAITGVAPAPIHDERGTHGGVLAMSGSF